MGRYVGLLLARRHPAKQATLVRKSTLGDKLFALKLLDATLQLRNLALVEFYGLRRGGHRNRCLGGALMLWEKPRRFGRFVFDRLLHLFRSVFFPLFAAP